MIEKLSEKTVISLSFISMIRYVSVKLDLKKNLIVLSFAIRSPITVGTFGTQFEIH